MSGGSPSAGHTDVSVAQSDSSPGCFAILCVFRPVAPDGRKFRAGDLDQDNGRELPDMAGSHAGKALTPDRPDSRSCRIGTRRSSTAYDRERQTDSSGRNSAVRVFTGTARGPIGNTASTANGSFVIPIYYRLHERRGVHRDDSSDIILDVPPSCVALTVPFLFQGRCLARAWLHVEGSEPYNTILKNKPVVGQPVGAV